MQHNQPHIFRIYFCTSCNTLLRGTAQVTKHIKDCAKKSAELASSTGPVTLDALNSLLASIAEGGDSNLRFVALHKKPFSAPSSPKPSESPVGKITSSAAPREAVHPDICPTVSVCYRNSFQLIRLFIPCRSSNQPRAFLRIACPLCPERCCSIAGLRLHIVLKHDLLVNYDFEFGEGILYFCDVL